MISKQELHVRQLILDSCTTIVRGYLSTIMSLPKKSTIKDDEDEDDSRVYCFDEDYEPVKDEEAKIKENKGKEPSKYIKGLLEAAELRKTENELRRFKKYAEDGDNGEEVFISTTYKRKLEDMKRLEEDKRRRLEHDKDNSMNFVKKFEAKLSKSNPDERNKEEERKSEDMIEYRDETPTKQTQMNVPRKELKTKKERRDYLRKLLAKRTVGKILDDAIARYNERRKAQKLER